MKVKRNKQHLMGNNTFFLNLVGKMWPLFFLIWSPLLFAYLEGQTRLPSKIEPPTDPGAIVYPYPTASSVEELKKLYPGLDWDGMNNTSEAKAYREKALQLLTEIRTAYKNKQMTESRLRDFERRKAELGKETPPMANVWPYWPVSGNGPFGYHNPFTTIPYTGPYNEGNNLHTHAALVTSEHLETQKECGIELKPLSKDFSIEVSPEARMLYETEKHTNPRLNKFTIPGMPLFPYFWRASGKEWKENPIRAAAKNQDFKNATKLWRDSQHWLKLAQEDEKKAYHKWDKTKIVNDAFRCRTKKRREMALKVQNEAFSYAKKWGGKSDAELLTGGQHNIEGGNELDVKMAKCLGSNQRMNRKRERRELLKKGSEFKNISCTPFFSLSTVDPTKMWHYAHYHTWHYSHYHKGPNCYDRTLSKPPALDFPQNNNEKMPFLRTDAEKQAILKSCMSMLGVKINGEKNFVSQIYEQFGSCIKQKKEENNRLQKEELIRQGYDQIECKPYNQWFDSFIFVQNDKATLNFNTQTIGLGGCTGYNTKTKKKSSWPANKIFLTASCEKDPLLVSEKIENNKLCFYGSYKEQLYDQYNMPLPAHRRRKVWAWRDDQVVPKFQIGTGFWSTVKNSNGEQIGSCFHPNNPTGGTGGQSGSE